MSNKRIVLNRRTQAEVVITEFDEMAALMTDRQSEVKRLAAGLVIIGQKALAEQLDNQAAAFTCCISLINERIAHIQAGAVV